jgi:hypothetical protein
MSKGKVTFIDVCLEGEAKPEDIDDFVDEWHRNSPRTPLIDVLGMSSFEYDIWTQNGDYLYHILGRRAVARAQEVARLVMPGWRELTAKEIKELFDEKQAESREKQDQRNRLEVEIRGLDEELSRLWFEYDKRLRAAGHTRGEGEA